MLGARHAQADVTSQMATVAEKMSIDSPVRRFKGDQARSVVAGHYEVDLDSPLGSGGMAVVYHGRDLRTRREVALKTLRTEYRDDPETRARFRREARTMAFLSHPNVIKVYDLFEDNDAPWAVMELAHGRPLKEEIAARGSFTVEDTARLLDQIAGALDHLHGRNLVHLDVKPQNLMVTPELDVKLIDFGLAQRAGQAQEMIGGSAFGTAAYLSPEQACGELVGVRTDVYALGCVVYEMLTGEPPFGADPANQLKNDVIRAHLDNDPAPPSAVRKLPGWVDFAVLKALAKKPSDRFSDCTSFAQAFWSGLETPPAVAPSPATATAKVLLSPIVETYDELFPERRREHRTATGALYRTGGRVARHTGWLRRVLWRVTIALLIGNVFLAGLLYINRGEVPGLVAGDASLQAGADARVMTNRLRLRAQPGRDAGIIGLLAQDQEIRVTGSSQDVEGETWWPVRATIDGETLSGYVASGWIEPVGGPGDAWLNRTADELKSLPGRFLDQLGVTGMLVR